MPDLYDEIHESQEHRSAWDHLVSFLSGEWMLETRPNGGTAVFLRAAWIAGVIYITGLILRNWIDPSRSFRFSFTEFRLQLLGSFRWFGTIFAGAYAALYARFASQWSYLASVYNQIKATECRGDANEPPALAQWKAAFID